MKKNLLETKIYNLPSQVGELCKSVKGHLCGKILLWLWPRIWENNSQFNIFTNSLLLDYWLPNDQYPLDRTTLNRRKDLREESQSKKFEFIFETLRSIVLIWSIVLISGERPPWTHNIFPVYIILKCIVFYLQLKLLMASNQINP